MNEKQDATPKTPLTKALESILTIDGQGRPAKARQLAELIKSTPGDLLLTEINKIGERKFF